MSNWRKSDLGSVANLVNKKPTYFSGEVPYLATSDVNGFSVESSETVTYQDRPSRADIIIEEGDVLQAKMKGTNKGLLVSDDMAGWLVSTGFAQFKPSEVGICNSFIYHVVTSNAFLSERDRLSVGSTQQAISDKDLKSIIIDIPLSFELQEKIARILSVLDRSIKKTEELIEKYQYIKAGLMHDLFTRGIGVDGHLRPPREQAPELYLETPIGWIPKEWSFKTLEEIVHFQRGHDIVESDFVEGRYPVVSSGGVIGFHNEYTTVGPAVVVGRKGTIGKVHYLEGNFWAHDTSLFSTTLYDNNPLFAYYLCNWLNLGRFGTKSGSPSLNRNDIHPLGVGRPSPNEQNKIVKRLEVSDKKIETLEANASKLTSMKFGLMHDLLTGEKTVNVEQPEAASV